MPQARHRPTRIVHLLVLGLLVSGPSATSHAEHICRYCQAPAGIWEGPGKPWRYAPDRVVDVLNLRIDVTPDFDEKTVTGETQITFTPIAKPAQKVELNAMELWVDSVESTHPLAEHSSTDEKLTLLFKEPIPLGDEVTVTIRYTCEPKRGLYFRTHDMGYLEGEDHIWTQGEPHEAPHWYPCFDYPNEKSTTEVICRVKPEMVVVSNGKMISETKDPETGLKVVHWRQSKPHANYLVCLVAGYFEKLTGESQGVDLGFYTQRTLAEHAHNAFQDTAAIMAFFEEEIGVAFPWDKYDQATIRDFTFGGMENTTITTLNDGTVYSDESENLRSSWGLDAHEMAHQWFGDYVTCKDWSHLWLNEGFATYYTHLYAEHKLGRDTMLYRLRADAEGRVLPGSKNEPRPIVSRRYSNPMEQFDFRSYPKGSWVLHMLRSQLGKDLYRKAVTKYLERHALTSVVSDDLRQVFEEVSGRPLDAFFEQWVYRGGVPRLQVSHSWAADDRLLKVTIKQTQKITEDAPPFLFPVTLRAIVDGEAIDHRVDVSLKQEDFYVMLPGKPEIVRFDPEYSLLAEVKHSKPQPMLELQLAQEGDGMGRVLAAVALGEKNNKKATAALAKALAEDPFYAVRLEAVKALGKQGTPEALEALLEAPDQSDARVRQQITRAIGSFFDDAAAEALRAIASDDKNPLIRGAALGGLAKYPEESSVELMLEGLKSESFQNGLAMQAVQAIGRRRDPSLGPVLLETLRERKDELPSRSYGRSLRSLARVYKDSDDVDPALDFLMDLLDDDVLWIRTGAIAALGELGDPRALAALEDLVDAGPRIGPAAEQAVKQLQDDSPASPSLLVRLREELRDFKQQQEKLEKAVERLTKAAKAKQAETKDDHGAADHDGHDHDAHDHDGHHGEAGHDAHGDSDAPHDADADASHAAGEDHADAESNDSDG